MNFNPKQRCRLMTALLHNITGGSCEVLIKMIVTDLDGTLLRRDKTVSKYTASVFARCRDKGIKVVFATARPVRAVKMLDICIANDACVYHNGAIIFMRDELFRHTGIDCMTAKNLLTEVGKFAGLRIAVEINDTLYANFDTSTIWFGSDTIITDFSDLPELSADKIIFITAKSDEIREIEKILDGNLYWEISENTVMMVMNKQARKRNAVKDIADYFGISLSEVAAFGDDYNDIEMLRECGSGVAVENAIDEVKAAADFICFCSDDDGVANWIEKHLL